MKLTKTITLIVLIGVYGLIQMACGNQQTKSDKYCGKELTNNEVARINNQEENAYEYSADDLDLLADLTTEVQELFNDTLIIEVFFFYKDKDKVGIYLIGPNNEIVVEKISCHILKSEVADKLPKDKYLLFYSNEDESLIAGIRQKKE